MAEGQSPEEEGMTHQNQHELHHQRRELHQLQALQLKQPNHQQVISVQHYQAPAPSNVIATINPDSASSTTKEEEWVTKKKVELTTKRQIETRVKRQVVLEDGRVVEDSGPIVTTNTTEDTEKQESSTTEKRDLAGDGENDRNGGANLEKGELEWSESAGGAVATQEGLVREVKEKKVCSRQETSELLETEDVQHLGDITDQDYQKAVQQGRDSDLRATLERCRRDTDASRRDRERQLQLHRWDANRNAAPGRVVHRSTKSRKVVDSEDSQRLHALGPDGKMITETRTTTEHEEIEGEEQPDSGSGSSHCEEDHKESSTQFARTKQQQLVDYYLGHKRIGGEIKYESENFEGDRRGAPLEHHPVDWDNLSARARASKQLQQQLDRKDALTRRPLDPDQEERTRKHETDRWLDSHFGSVSSDDQDGAQVTRPVATSSFINVTMKSSKSPVPATPPPYDVTNSGHHDVINSGHNVQSYLRTTSMSPVHHRTHETSSSMTPNRSNQTNERYSYSRSHFDRSDLSSPVERIVPSSSPAPAPAPAVTSSTWYSTVQRNGHGGRAVVSSEEETASPSPPVRPRRRRGQDTDKESSRQLIETERRWRSQHSLVNGYTTPDHVAAPDATPGGGYATPTSTPPLPYNGVSDYPHSPSPPPLHHSTPYRVEGGRGYSPSPTSELQRGSPQLIDEGGSKKKIFQRTRFAAEIPLVKPKPQGGEPAAGSKQGGLGLGRSLRKLVNKLGGGGKSTEKKQDAATAAQSEPRLHHHQQQSYQQPVQRYYLGEDPFSGSSIYGRESEYHAAAPRRRHSNRIPSDHNSSHQNGFRSTSTLGRLSKSTGRLASSSSADRTTANARAGGVHTLPRKLHNGVSWQQQQNYRNQETSSNSSRLNSDHRSGSLINVSIVNKPKPTTTSTTTTFTSTLGPAKPARTYRSSLLRSKSFSAQANDTGISMSPSVGGGGEGIGGMGGGGLHHASNPQLHRLLQPRGDDSPLKSPGIVTSISRRDASRDASRNLLVRRLIDRVPQLYDALHGNNGSGGQFGNTANGNSAQFGNTVNGTSTTTTTNNTQFGNTVNGTTTKFGNTANGNSTQFGNTVNSTTTTTQFGNTTTKFGNAANGSGTQFGNTVNGTTTKFGTAVNGSGTQFGNTVNGTTTKFGNAANGSTAQFGNSALGNGQSSVWTTSTTTVENHRYRAPVDRRGSLSSGGVVIEVRSGD